MWWRSLRQKSGLSSHCLPSALSSLGQACSCRKVDARVPSLSSAHCRPMTMHACRCRKAEEGSSKTRHAFKRARVKGNFLPPWKSIPSKGSKAIHFPFSGLWSFSPLGQWYTEQMCKVRNFRGGQRKILVAGALFWAQATHSPAFPSAGLIWSPARCTRRRRQRSLARRPAATPPWSPLSDASPGRRWWWVRPCGRRGFSTLPPFPGKPPIGQKTHTQVTFAFTMKGVAE